MNHFFKSFFAALLALVVFTVIGFFLLAGFVSGLAMQDTVKLENPSVLVVDLGTQFKEQQQENPLAQLGGDEQYDVPGVYDVVRLIQHARLDSTIKGIYIKCNGNSNGWAASEDIRQALLEFKQSHKFIIGYGDVISQKAYYVASVADSLYCNPQGGVEWNGMTMQTLFLKGLLDKLDVKMQIFYAGKFKSATEIFRLQEMSDANRLQSSVILGDMYGYFLQQVANARGIDTTTLRGYANNFLIQSAGDALRYKLVDGLKYDDQLRDLMRANMKLDKYKTINMVSLAKYAKAVSYKQRGTDRIALIYAEGDVIDGKGERSQIGSVTYVNLLRKAREDDQIKAIVVRVNSGGGSALASENIWREITLAREKKPVVVSFGDVAASGAYYLSCNADSIFAQPNTITGSIGVFSIVPNMRDFLDHKLGVTFDEVSTNPEGSLSLVKPLTPMQQRYFQNQVDSTYLTFMTRVADGRHLTIPQVDSIGQGRIWSGSRALQLGLVDRLGSLQDAVACAARMAKTNNYRLREYPEPQSFLEMLFGSTKDNTRIQAVKEELGPEGVKLYTNIKKVKELVGSTQMRLPGELSFE